MKKKVFLIPLAMFMVTGTVGLAGCDPIKREDTPVNPQTATLINIAVKSKPAKTTYNAGETFDSTGLVIEATYSDGSKKNVTGWTVDKAVLAAGDNVVTVTYTEGEVTKTATIAITVNGSVDPTVKTLTGIAVTHLPDKVRYVAGDEFDPAGLEVTASYSDTSSHVVTTGLSFDKTTLSLGDTEVVVSYSEGQVTKTAVIAITVADPDVDSLLKIEVTKEPTKTTYNVGDEFDPAGLVVTAYYTISEPHVVNATCSDPDMSSEGDKIVTVTYVEDGVTATTEFTITVEKGDVTTITPTEAIALMDAAGDGVIVSGLKQVKGICASGSKYDSQYKQYTTGFDGVSNFKLQFIDNDNILNGASPDGMEIVVEGYLEKYQGKYQLSYLPASASPTGEKFTPNLISAEAVHHEGVLESITVSESHREFYVGGAFVGETVTAHYSDGSTATVSASFSGYNMSAKGTQTVNVSYTEGDSTVTTSYTITVSERTLTTITPTEAIALMDAAGDGVVVSGLKQVKGICASGSKYDSQYKQYTTGFDGVSNFKLQFTDNDNILNGASPDGMEIVVEGYLEKYQGKYQLSYLPASASPTGEKFTPNLISAQSNVTLESITADMTNKTYEVGQALSLEGLTVTGHYSDGSTATITEGYQTSLEAGHSIKLDDTSLRITYGDLHFDIALTVTDPSLVLESISVSGVKETYYKGEKLGNVVVTAHYEGGKTQDVTRDAVLKIGDAVVDATHEMAFGESKLVATYQGENAEAQFEVVEDTVVSIAVSSEHRSFNVGAEFVKETVTATFKSGATKDVTGEASFTGYKMDVADTYTVTVSYGGQETTYDITVTYKEVYTPVALTKDASIGGTDATFNEIAGIKCGTSSSGGSVDLTLPKGTTKVSFYAAAWRGETTSLTVSGLGENKEFSLTADDGMTGNSPFTLVKDIETFHITFDLTSPLTAQKKITVASEGKRFGIWDAGVKVEEIHVTGVEIVGYPDEIYVGDKLTADDFLIDVTYDKAPKQEGIHPDSFDLDTFAAGKASLTVTFDGFTTEPLEVEIKEARYVTGVTIVDYPKEITEGDEISVFDILVDVTYSVGGDSKGIHPDSYSLSVPVSGKASLTATVGGVPSSAVEVTVMKADVLTPIELSTTGGTNASECKVQISSDNARDGIKCGTSSKAGTMQMVLPAGTAKVVFYAAGWTGSSATLSVTGLDSEKTFSLKANAGLTGNSPFTFSGVEDFSQYKIEIVLDAPLESETTITLAAGNTRFAVWDAAAVIEQKTVTGVVITDWPKSIEQDYVIKKDEVTVTLTYDDGTTATGKHPDSVYCNASEVGTAKLTATVGGVTSKEVDVAVNAVDPSTEKTATIAYTGSTTTNMDGNNQAALLGVTDSHISVVGTKTNGGQNNVGLNQAGQIRLYKNETSTLTISISGGTISKIDVVLGGTFGGLNCNGTSVSDAAANKTVTVGVDGTSVAITNPHGSTQTYILSIVVYYTLD